MSCTSFNIHHAVLSWTVGVHQKADWVWATAVMQCMPFGTVFIANKSISVLLTNTAMLIGIWGGGHRTKAHPRHNNIVLTVRVQTVLVDLLHVTVTALHYIFWQCLTVNTGSCSYKSVVKQWNKLPSSGYHNNILAFYLIVQQLDASIDI